VVTEAAARLRGRLAALLARLGEEDPDLGALAAPLAGRRLALEGLLPGGRRLVIAWDSEGPSFTLGDDPADLVLAGPPGAFLDLLLRGESRRLHLTGRLDLARDLARYLHGLGAARREILALLLGDPLLGLAERGGERLGSLVAEAVRTGRGPAALLVTRDRWAEIARAAEEIRTRAQALASDPRLHP